MNGFHPLSRRQFVKRSLTFALGAPLILSASSCAPRLSRRHITPSSRINLGFIGVGRMARDHLAGFLGYDDVQVVAVCDVAKPRRDDAVARVQQAYARRTKFGVYKGCADYSDFRQLLARRDVDAVVIATPDHWHAIPAIEACKAGVHVYCEKPLSHTIREGEMMVKAARSAKIAFQTGSQQRTEYDGRFKRAVELVRSGRIGQLKTIRVAVGPPPKPCDLPEQATPEGYDWDMWLGPAPYRGFNEILCPLGVHNNFPHWRAYQEYAGGQLADWGAHHFDIAQWAMGLERSGPNEIIPPAGAGLFGLVFRYDNGVEMHHVEPAPGVAGIVFEGSSGTINVDRGLLVSSPEDIVTTPLGAKDFHLPDHGPDHKRDWLNAIRTGETTVADAEIGARTAAVAQLAIIGYQLRRPLQWSPRREHFIGDNEANRLRDMPRREPWRL